jgi:KDO2-lipid IV(A) lauroyltransferase
VFLVNPQRLLPWGSRGAAALPRPAAAWLADRAGDLAWALAPAARRTVATNLEHTLEHSPSPRLVRQSFRAYARYYQELMRLAHQTPEQAVGRLTWRCFEALDASLGRGRGALVLTGHYGNWDVLGIGLAARYGVVTTFAERLQPRSLFEFYSKLRSRHGIHVTPADDPGRAPILALQRNSVVAFVADRPFGARVAEVACGGARLSVPTGAIRLALRHGTPIHTAFARRTPEGYELGCGADCSADVAHFADEATRIDTVAARFAAELARWVGNAPEQWCLHAPLAVWSAAPIERPAAAARGAA